MAEELLGFWFWSAGPSSSGPGSLPDFDDAVSGRGDDEALRGLKGGDVRDDVMVSYREGLRAAAGRVLGGAALLLAVDLLQRQEDADQNHGSRTVSSCPKASEWFSVILVPLSSTGLSAGNSRFLCRLGSGISRTKLDQSLPGPPQSLQ